MAKFLLAVDAGHGKWVGGNRCMRSLDPNQTAEWVLGDRVARAIIERAKLYDGFETIRVDDPTGEDDVGLTKRCAKANAAGVDFYISLHFDAGIGGGSGGGITTFCVATGGKAEMYRNRIYNSVINAGGIRGDRANPLQTANYFVLRETVAPAVLIECGFMDSRTDVPIILNPAYEKKIGEAIADCIADINGLKRTGRFVDVRPTDYFYNAVNWAVDKKITSGVDDSHFAPNSVCTRGQAVTMLWAKNGRPDCGNAEFEDVKPTDWYNKAVAWAKQSGISSGVGGNKFAPNDPCTRAQIVTMLWRLAGSPTATNPKPFADVKPNDYFYQATMWAREKGVTSGIGGNKFGSNRQCTRAEFVTMAYKTR